MHRYLDEVQNGNDEEEELVRHCSIPFLLNRFKVQAEVEARVRIRAVASEAVLHQLEVFNLKFGFLYRPHREHQKVEGSDTGNHTEHELPYPVMMLFLPEFEEEGLIPCFGLFGTWSANTQSYHHSE